MQDSWQNITMVVPVYNRARLIAPMLEGLRCQEVLPARLILVDNASTDDSVAVMQKWKDENHHLPMQIDIVEEKRKGAARARQTGLELVETPWVLFFDSDDTMHPDHIRRIKETVETQPDLDIVAWPVAINFVNGKRTVRHINTADTLMNHMVQGLLSTQAYAVRTDFIKSIGGWNVDLGGWDDWELGLRLLLENPRMKVLPTSTVETFNHAESLTGFGYLHSRGAWERAMDAMQTVIESSYHPRRDFLLRMLAYRRVILAAHYYHEGDKEAASTLRAEALKENLLNNKHRILLGIAYEWTRRGLPGAGRIIPNLL